MAERRDLTPDNPEQAGVNTGQKPEVTRQPKKDRTRDRHPPGYMAAYMRAWRATQRRMRETGSQ